MFRLSWGKSILIIVLAGLLITSLILPGCSKTAVSNNPAATGNKTVDINIDNIKPADITPLEWTKSPAPSPIPEITPATGKIETGSMVSLASKSIEKSGGTITVDKPGDPLNGLKIKVPAEAYPASTSFKISSAPVTSHTFGKDFNPLSPLITVENGGKYAEGLMEMTVPVKVPAGHFAMGFLYDEKSGKLEGMPLINSDSGSVTVATRHFSKVVISSILETALTDNADSGFRPGIDDFEFPNAGSIIEPSGHCAGQSVAAMWYYCEKPEGPKARLWDKYDNYGHGGPTTDFWYDDSYAYRWASVVQNDMRWYANQERKLLDKINGVSDQITWKMFSYAMQLTREPQFIYIAAVNSAHAMVVYKIQDGALWISDPNKPSNPYRKIEYSGGKFKPYNSGNNAAEIAQGKTVNYTSFTYYAKTTLFNWSQIGDRWQQVKAKTIGDAEFPDYQMAVRKDPKGKFELATSDIIKTNQDTVLIIPVDDDLKPIPYSYARDGKFASSEKGWIKLSPGDNKIGLYIFELENKLENYLDFKYITVNYEPADLAIEPKDFEGLVNTPCTFTAKSKNPVTGAVYKWSLNGTVNSQIKGATYTSQFAKTGEYTLAVQMLDSKGNKIADATTKFIIKDKDKLAMLQQMKSASVSIAAFATMSQMNSKVNWEGWADPASNSSVRTAGDLIAITWKGTAFTSVAKTSDGQPYFTGEVSSDGNKVVRFILNPGKDWYYDSNTQRWSAQVTISDIALNWPSDTSVTPGSISGKVNGAAISGHISNPVYIFESWNWDPDKQTGYKTAERKLLSYDYAKKNSNSQESSLSIGFGQSFTAKPSVQMGKVPKDPSGSPVRLVIPGSSQ